MENLEQLRVQRAPGRLVFSHMCGRSEITLEMSEIKSEPDSTTAQLFCPHCQKIWPVRGWNKMRGGLEYFSRSGQNGYRVMQRGLQLRFVKQFEINRLEKSEEVTSA